MKKNPYNNIKLKFPLSERELKNIDKVWEFINDFRETKITRNKYKKYIIKKLKNKYDIKDFYNLENVVEKLYWNLAQKIKEEINLKPEIFYKETFDLNQTKNKILMRNNKIKESTIDKTYIITKSNKLLYKYRYPNDLDLLVSSIMINRSIYETIMSDEAEIFNLEIEPYSNIVEFDYMYPNLNTIKSFTKTKSERMNNIKNMYYDDKIYQNTKN
jgi:hypothetical protein